MIVTKEGKKIYKKKKNKTTTIVLNGGETIKIKYTIYFC
jgi:hypothetical protein